VHHAALLPYVRILKRCEEGMKGFFTDRVFLGGTSIHSKQTFHLKGRRVRRIKIIKKHLTPYLGTGIILYIGGDEMERLTIGKVAKQAEVNIETIRYYEWRGLIPRPPRRESGYRQYPRDTVTRIQFIKRAKELGFSLREILELLSLKLRLDPNTTCGDVKKRAEIKIADIEEKIRTLQGMKRALITLTMECKGSAPVSECPILEALGTRGESAKVYS